MRECNLITKSITRNLSYELYTHIIENMNDRKWSKNDRKMLIIENVQNVSNVTDPEEYNASRNVSNQIGTL